MITIIIIYIERIVNIILQKQNKSLSN